MTSERRHNDQGERPQHPGSLGSGDLVELQADAIAHGGVCVARHEGRVIFVADTIPGERVRARITDVKKNFARAVTVDVLEASEDRRPHFWAEAALERDPDERAGGAEFGHIALDAQRPLKAEVLVDSMARFGGVEIGFAPGTEPIEPSLGDLEHGGLGYRTRVRLHVDPESGVVGPMAARSNRVIQVESLPLATLDIDHIAPLDETFPGVQSIDLVAPTGDDARMLVAERVPAQAQHRARNQRRAAPPARTGENDRVREVVAGLEMQVRAGGFWQVHREAPSILFTAVSDLVADLANNDRFDPGAANLDLYGGAGLLAAALANGALNVGAENAGGGVRITTVESDAAATDDAAENLAGLAGSLAVTAKVDAYLRELHDAPAQVRDRLRRATVVLDPPRAGAGRSVIERLTALSPANVIYVACDPVALARDTALLGAAGYEIERLRAFDLFPHTHHFETIASFSRA